jgi:3-hydroxybutyryl-CoA dehydrogenase
MTTTGSNSAGGGLSTEKSEPHRQTVGVIGAGVMGVGLAQALAQSGLRALLVDVSDSVLDSAMNKIGKNVRLQRLFQKTFTGDPKEIMARIEPSVDYQVLRQADFVIENVTEKIELKSQVYAHLDSVCPPHCVFAANTSAIPITRIGSMTARPQQVLGIHFMNPVPLKNTVELIPGFHTSDAAVDTARKLLALMGKQAVLVKDSPGFVSNRVLMLTVNEAIFLLHENVASAEAVDTIFKNCFGHKMGPLETADLIGLDTILFSIEVLYQEFNDSKFRPCPLLRQMVDAGLHGRKSGRGFYTYAE